jgi:hypothetical protein
MSLDIHKVVASAFTQHFGKMVVERTLHFSEPLPMMEFQDR